MLPSDSHSNSHKPDRQVRLAEFLRQRISPALQNFVPLNTLVTLTNVETDEKGSFAKLFVTVLPDTQEQTVLKTLQQNVPELRRYLAEKMNRRFVPELTIAIDKGQKTRERIDDIIRNEHSRSKPVDLGDSSE